MKRLSSNETGVVPTTAAVLSSGGVAVLPTDTLHGFSAVISIRSAYDRLLAIKRYASPRSFIYLADTVECVEGYVSGWGCAGRERLAGIWPAPLSAVLPAGGDCPPWIGATIAFRIPDHQFSRDVVAAVGEPLVSTSLNAAGEVPSRDVEAWGDQLDLVVWDAAGVREVRSTVVDFTGAVPVVLRPGALSWPEAADSSK